MSGFCHNFEISLHILCSLDNFFDIELNLNLDNYAVNDAVRGHSNSVHSVQGGGAVRRKCTFHTFWLFPYIFCVPLGREIGSKNLLLSRAHYLNNVLTNRFYAFIFSVKNCPINYMATVTIKAIYPHGFLLIENMYKWTFYENI